MFKKFIAFIKKEKSISKCTEEQHIETEGISAEEDGVAIAPDLKPLMPATIKFADDNGNIYEVAPCSEEFDEMMCRRDVRLIFG